MKSFTYATIVLSTTAIATGQNIIMDQIGDLDGSGIGTGLPACQYFEDAYSIYSVAVLDNFSIATDITIAGVEAVINGWGGFIDPSAITGYQTNVYTDPTAASLDLVGDIATDEVDVADSTVNPDWAGIGFLISAPTTLEISTGEYWFAMIPYNAFTENGQTGVSESLIGDGILSWQANPGGGFGMPNNMQETAGESAYRLVDDGIYDPCSSPLPETCTADVDGDMIVAVGDILAIIGNWGDCGDGTYRPVGDIAPLPNGDCCVTVTDILTVIGAWGNDCTPRGACCSQTGLCTDNLTVEECLAFDGEYLGDDSLCSDGQCLSGACCIDVLTCIDGISPAYCDEYGGTFQGDGTLCADISCDGTCDATGCQLADLDGHGEGGIIGATSDTNPSAGYVVADTLNPTADGVISQVCWWGMYIDFGASTDCGADGPGTGDNFTITYYLDNADTAIPGSLHAGPFSVFATVDATGDVIPSGIGDIVQYEYTTNHPPVKVQSGMCYWISISNETDGSCFWLWETAPPGDSRSAQDNGGWGESDYDLAFCVDIDITTDGCGVFSGPCCLPDSTCVIMSSLDCGIAEGEYGGNNLTCADVNDCQPIPGACCFGPDSCFEDTTDEECDAFGGTFMGENSLCSDVNCGSDQIGGSDGGSLDGNITASQIFEQANQAYNIATLDNFSFTSQTTVESIEAVINGWNGYSDLSSITNYTISVYSSVEAAGADLVGDVYSIGIVTPNLPTWTGLGDLVSFDLNLVLPAGEYYFAIIPWNDFGIGGQTGISGSTLGDGTFFQANPNGGFGFGPWQEGEGNSAYRINTQ